ncbi:leucine-rich repeat and death domain-containing protein 1-like [Leptopilina heterotoma]|uniref:leucine-rich repeat and death domain-containing protein 1-like n=1 Tax=Leptopilina heterotoma TaxID=63436 RepID=UPI001CA9F2E6|nr:leucine-rich repeat and death domain-containing protein 1-like [Leptopilina heterotoma]
MTNNNSKLSDYLEKIETDDIAEMSGDTNINMNFQLLDNSITAFCDKKDLRIVQELSLCFNKLSCIPNNFSQHLINLEKLDLSNNNLQELPTSFSSLSNLQYLKIDNNKFVVMPIVLAGNQRLKSLSICHNSLNEISEELGSLITLEHLNLSFNKLIKFPKSFAKLHRLRELNIAGNKFDIIPSCITNGMRNLEILDVSLNKSIKLNEPPCSKRLIKFYAMDNGLCRTFPRWLLTSPYSSVEEVNFNQTEFSKYTFPKDKVVLNLRILSINQSDLTDNNLEMLTENMYRLEKLDIGNDKLTKKEGNVFCNVPCHFKNPQLINEIDMKFTGLPIVSRLITNLANITKIDFSQNSISWLPDEFCNLSKLEILIINNNSIPVLPDNIGNLKALRELVIYSNQLSRLPESMCNVKELRLLDLYDNELKEIPWNAVNLENLEAIDIDCNFFSTDDLTIRNKSYEIFRKSIRGKCVSFGKRSSEEKISPREEESVQSSESSCSKYYESDHTENDYQQEDLDQMCDNGAEENWESSYDSTDDYEPACVSRRKQRKSSLVEDVHGQFFCPDDLHALPIKQQVRQMFNDRRQIPRTFEEGQFDDA